MRTKNVNEDERDNDNETKIDKEGGNQIRA